MLRGDKVPEPHVRQLVRDELDVVPVRPRIPRREVLLRPRVGEPCIDEGRGAHVLHPPHQEVMDGDLRVLLVGVLYARERLEDPEHLRGLPEEPGGVGALRLREVILQRDLLRFILDEFEPARHERVEITRVRDVLPPVEGHPPCLAPRLVLRD